MQNAESSSGCPHFSASRQRRNRNGYCAIGLFGYRPSAGICRHCLSTGAAAHPVCVNCGGAHALAECPIPADTTPEIERVVRVAATLARGRRRKLTSVDKANVLTTSRLWRSVTTRIMRDEFPDIALDHMLVDACAMHLIRRPADFDVIVTENMFGDILTDEASMLAGSMGMLPSASLGNAATPPGATRLGLYEPIHGSAPDIAGRGVANPLGTILSVALLLRYSLGLEREACAVEQAVHETIDAGILSADLAPLPPGAHAASTRAVGDAVTEALARLSVIRAQATSAATPTA